LESSGIITAQNATEHEILGTMKIAMKIMKNIRGLTVQYYIINIQRHED
jgi:hypothetical protein